MSDTAHKMCTCTNEYMDKKYGRGVRVMNLSEKGGRDYYVYRCTVCGKEHRA